MSGLFNKAQFQNDAFQTGPDEGGGDTGLPPQGHFIADVGRMMVRMLPYLISALSIARNSMNLLL